MWLMKLTELKEKLFFSYSSFFKMRREFEVRELRIMKSGEMMNGNSLPQMAIYYFPNRCIGLINEAAFF
jgi:hypothetical protein